jgi:DNA-binding MarR family transcriptional regulator
MLNSVPRSRDSELLATAERLRVAIFRTARRLRQEAGAELGPALLAALGTIERHGPVTPSELADLEGVKRPTATRMIARLETEALIERARDPADRRSSLVSVGPAGAALMRRLRKRRTAYLARRLRALEASDVAVLARATEVLERIVEGERR